MSVGTGGGAGHRCLLFSSTETDLFLSKKDRWHGSAFSFQQVKNLRLHIRCAGCVAAIVLRIMGRQLGNISNNKTLSVDASHGKSH
jgi:hypothetical protein